MRTVHFFRTASGTCPVEEFLDGLPAAQARKVAWVLRLIEELDTIPAQYFKKLVNADGLWEVRVEHGGAAIRLLGFLDGSRLVVLNHAFMKKSQKTPAQDIRLAGQRMADYRNRRRA